MIELIFSFLVTILPDYLYRRYGQGKRLGEEITLYNFWYELRWGITACAVMTITLITVIFYFHPIASNVLVGFRTVSIIADRPGRVEEVYVTNNQDVKAGDRIFRLDTSRRVRSVRRRDPRSLPHATAATGPSLRPDHLRRRLDPDSSGSHAGRTDRVTVVPRPSGGFGGLVRSPGVRARDR